MRWTHKLLVTLVIVIFVPVAIFFWSAVAAGVYERITSGSPPPPVPSPSATSPLSPPSVRPSTPVSTHVPVPAPKPPPSPEPSLDLNDKSLLPARETPTAACLDAFRELEPADGYLDDWNDELAATLTACNDVPGYLGGYYAYPKALGADSGDWATPWEFMMLCLFVDDSAGTKYPVCVDARRRGFLPQD